MGGILKCCLCQFALIRHFREYLSEISVWKIIDIFTSVLYYFSSLPPLFFPTFIFCSNTIANGKKYSIKTISVPNKILSAQTYVLFLEKFKIERNCDNSESPNIFDKWTSFESESIAFGLFSVENVRQCSQYNPLFDYYYNFANHQICQKSGSTKNTISMLWRFQEWFAIRCAWFWSDGERKIRKQYLASINLNFLRFSEVQYSSRFYLRFGEQRTNRK